MGGGKNEYLMNHARNIFSRCDPETASFAPPTAHRIIYKRSRGDNYTLYTVKPVLKDHSFKQENTTNQPNRTNKPKNGGGGEEALCI